MPLFCAVVGCSNRGGRDKKSFYRIPAVITNQGSETQELSAQRRTKWIASISRKDWEPTAHTRVCGDHFHSGKPAALYEKSNPDWVPTISLGHKISEGTSTVEAVDRHARRLKRVEHKKNLSAAETLLQLYHPRLETEPTHVEEIPVSHVENGVQSQTDITSSDIGNIERELVERNCAIYQMRQTLDEQVLSKETFEGDDTKVKFYTGLPNFCILMAVFDLISPHLPSFSNITPFQQCIITLMRLRLNLPIQDLAYRFSSSKTTISRIVSSVIDILYARLKHCVFWPEREDLRKTMPMTFREKFGQKVAVIIDCFEVFIDKPSSLLARAQTWSSYKHHNTVKFLIGVTPQGVISFISKAWGGRVSDKRLTEESGFLDNLLPGDIVLADRGFTISESVGMMCAEVNIPAFTKGKKQLSAFDIEQTRKIAHVRIHVERVIGLVRQKYSVLQSTLPIEYMSKKDDNDLVVLDRMVHVCCALTNLSDSVVPFD